MTFKPSSKDRYELRADSALGQDVTGQLQGLIDEYRYAIVLPGEYRLDGMITMPGDAALMLCHGASLRRLSAFSASTEPLIWLRNSRSTIQGESIACNISSENASPEGVVRVGHENLQDPGRNCNLCRVDRIWIQGSTVNGDGVSSGLYIASSANTSGLVSYFHWIGDIRSFDCEYAFRFDGEVNGCQMQRLHAFRSNVGMFWNGGVENQISGFFHHQSPGGTSYLIGEPDNTATGGKVHFHSLNTFSGLVVEPGGASVSIDASASTGQGNYVEIISNTPGGFNTPVAWDNLNQVHFGRFARIPDLSTNGGAVGTI